MAKKATSLAKHPRNAAKAKSGPRSRKPPAPPEPEPVGTHTPWTIKSFEVATRKVAVACAARADLSVGEWLARAVYTQARTEAEDNMLLPLSSSAGAPERAATGKAPGPVKTMVEVSQCAAILMGVSKSAARRLAKMVESEARTLFGLEPYEYQPAGKPIPFNGQTYHQEVIEHAHAKAPAHPRHFAATLDGGIDGGQGPIPPATRN